jgi:glycosyltransferase involved in cell wall biosynthesis
MGGSESSVSLSVVVPLFNEAQTLPELVRRLGAVLDGVDGDNEVILVDDGSADSTYELASAAVESDERFRVLRLSRNFGHQIAISAGLDAAGGEAVVIMDGDLQDPPEVIPDLVERWKEGFEIVHAVRISREGEPRLRKARAALFYRLLRRLTETDIPADVGDFRLVDRRALAAFRSMRERNRYIRGMFSWIGFRQTMVGYVREARFAGESKYPLRKLAKLGADGVLSFSNAPLRLALRLGFVISTLALAFAVFAVVARLANLYEVPGIASVLVLTALLGGVQLILLGLQGEYVARIYDEVKARPLYLVQETLGFSPAGERPVAAYGHEERSP